MWIFVFRGNHFDRPCSDEMLKDLLDQLGRYSSSRVGLVCRYPSFGSPSVMASHLEAELQWTMRDGNLVQVPRLLLVQGDTVLVRTNPELSLRYRFVDHPGDNTPNLPCFQPSGNEYTYSDQLPSARRFSLPGLAVVTQAPLVDFFNSFRRVGLSQKPISAPSFVIFFRIVLVVSLFLRLSLGATFIVGCALRTFLNQYDYAKSFTSLACFWLFHATASLLFCCSGVLFSLVWLSSLLVATARLQRFINWFGHDLPATTFCSSQHLNTHTNSFSDTSSVHMKLTLGAHNIAERLKAFKSKICLARDQQFEELLLTLGSVSSVCCIDREGILSRPVPTPEKVFFFHKRHHHRENSISRRLNPLTGTSGATPEIYSEKRKCRQTLFGCLSSCEDEHFPSTPTKEHLCTPNSLLSPPELSCGRAASVSSGLGFHDVLRDDCYYHPVVLDLRSDTKWPHPLSFEKNRWAHFLSSLKPIGLSLLLNNCHSPLSFQRLFFKNYLKSCRYWSNNICESDRFIPLSFCLCELAHLMGFRDDAIKGFTSCGCLGAYRFGSQPPLAGLVDLPNGDNSIHGPCDIGTYGFSHLNAARASVASCFSAVFSDSNMDAGYQLMSEGTGDMLASLCSDVWDGRDIYPMTSAARRTLLDFYHRNASAAYCFGLAYTPLLDKVTFADHTLPHDKKVLDPNMSFVLLCLPRTISPQPSTGKDFPETNKRSSPRLGLPPLAFDFDDFSDNAEGKLPNEGDTHTPNDNSSYFSEPLNSPLSSGSFNLSCHGEHRDVRVSAKRCSEWLGTSDNDVIRMTCLRLKGAAKNPDLHNANLASRRPYSGDFTNVHKEYASRFPTKQTSVNAKLDASELQAIAESQIFLGLISMQYQANNQVLQTIKHLEEACIRFVYFSRENELRSRVFAERLGLECGWNCHISLASPTQPRPSPSVHESKESEMSQKSTDVGENGEKEPGLTTSPGHAEYQPPRKRSRSASRLSAFGIQVDHLKESKSCPTVCGRHDLHEIGNYQFQSSGEAHSHGRKSTEYGSGFFRPRLTRHSIHGSCPLGRFTSEVQIQLNDDNQSIPSLKPSDIDTSTSDNSIGTSSSSSDSSCQDDGDASEKSNELRLSDYVTENKSRLPCGIESIRPHLENVDNVPLQVSLFTDCTPKAVYEMITIMQEYGETVCTVGSCFSTDNILPLARGNVSIMVRPLMPKPCPAFSEAQVQHPTPQKFREFTSIPDSLHVRRCSAPGALKTRYRKSDVEFDILDSVPLKSQPSKPPSAFEQCSTTPQPLVDALDLVVRIRRLLTPCMLDLGTQGFRVYEILHEAHASVNNFYLVITFCILAPMCAALLQLCLILVGLPSLPFLFDIQRPEDLNSSSNGTGLAWLPSEFFRTRLIPVSDEALRYPTSESLDYTITMDRFNTNAYRLMPTWGAGQLMWLMLIVIPLLSLTLVDRRVERLRPLREPPVKRGKLLTKKKCMRVVLITAAHFLPSTFVCVLTALGYFLFAPNFCSCARLADFTGSTDGLLNGTSRNITVLSECNWTESISFDRSSVQDECFAKLALLVTVTQDVIYSQLVFYLVLVSFTYANHGQPLIKFSWSTNPSWCVSSITILAVQGAYLSVKLFRSDQFLHILPFQILSPVVFILSLLWGLVLIVFNECVDWKERMLIRTEHRLARLYFGTKLGMYSPV
ncbi:unnamed protein product [Calicophoron daubneyi]